MKTTSLTLSLVCALGVICSIAYAMPVRVTATVPNNTGLDANGNPTNNTRTEIFIKAIGFPDSGLIINRFKSPNVVNESGKRTVFRNVPFIRVVDPLNNCRIPEITRSRIVFPKGRVRKMNLVTMRGVVISNPNRPPIGDSDDPR